MKTYTFQVSLPDYGEVWRKLELPAEATLEQLHFAIQDAYDFDGDHLYSFFMSGKAWDTATEYSLPDDADSWGSLLGFDEEEAPDETPLNGEAELTEVGPTELPTAQDLRTMFAALQDNPEMREQFIQAFTEQMGMPPAMVQMMLDNLDSLMANASDEQLDEMMDRLDEELEEDDELAGDVRTTTLDSLVLRKGKSFMYLFDYGDEWRFKVKVASIDEKADPNAVYPRLVETFGEAPAQYADWDDEEDDDDDALDDNTLDDNTLDDDEQEDGEGI